MAAPNAHIAAAIREVNAFHLGAGLLAGGADQDPLETPQQRAARAPAATRPTAADLAADWASTPQAEFLELANAVIVAFRDRYGADTPYTVPVPKVSERASSAYRDCKELQVIFSRSLTLTAKLAHLRAVAAAAVASAAVQRARTTGGIANSIRAKRAKSKASKASFAHGIHAYGGGKRSPHVSLGKRSPPPQAAGAIGSWVRRGITQRHDEDPPEAGAKIRRD
jgi:hypothetical protein